MTILPTQQNDKPKTVRPFWLLVYFDFYGKPPLLQMLRVKMARLMVVFLIFREFITPTLLKIWILGGSADALFDFGFVMKLTVKSNSQIEDTDPKVLAVQMSQYNIIWCPKVLIYVVWSYPDRILKPNLCKPRTQYASLFWSLPTATVSITLHLWQSVHIYFDTSIFGRVSFSISVGWHGLKNMSLPSPLHRKVSFSLCRRVYSSVGWVSSSEGQFSLCRWVSASMGGRRLATIPHFPWGTDWATAFPH